jgi:hypothetical protein
MAPFAYWDGEGRAQIAAFSAEWTNAFPSFRVDDDRNALPLIEQYFPEYVKIYMAIRLPAAKCTVARLILLYKFGGLYIDCHVGIRDRHALRRLLTSLSDVDSIFVDRNLALKRPAARNAFSMITVLFNRPRVDLMLTIANQALANLARHRESEYSIGYCSCNIYTLCGTALFNSMVLQPDMQNIRGDHKLHITIVKEEEAPVARDRHRTYGGPGRHWSERQTNELLFDPKIT